MLGEVSIVDKDGKPFNELEPVMGTFAHIVAVSEDFKTIEHIHPLGILKHPKVTARGGPKQQFNITSSKVGYLKIYVQIQAKGKSYFIPFGVQIIP